MGVNPLHRRHSQLGFQTGCFFADATATVRMHSPAWTEDYLFCDKHAKKYSEIGHTEVTPLTRTEDEESEAWD